MAKNSNPQHWGITCKLWHDALAMPKYSREWHEQDIKEEYEELQEAERFIDRWSEYSDVVYTLTRSRWSGFKDLQSPLTNTQCIFGTIYMFPKYTLRYWFYKSAARKAGCKKNVTEIRNPKKVHKLREIANRYEMDADTFTDVCEKQLRYWPLLK